MTYEEIFKKIDPISGWMGIEDGQVLYKYAKKTNGLIVEIGAYAGRSTMLMSYASPESKVIAIESFKMGETDLKKNIEGRNIEVIKGNSHIVGKKWDREIDLLHIDGDHRYKSVKRDIELFAPHVKKGGYIILHDFYVFGNPERIIRRKDFDTNDRRFYNDKNYGVVKAVDKCRNLLGKIKSEEGFAVCQKY